MGDAVSPAASADMGDGENEGEDGQHEESTVADEAQALLDKFASVQILKVCSLVALCRTNSKALTCENFEQDPNDPAVASDTLVQAAALFEREEAVFRDTCSDSFSVRRLALSRSLSPPSQPPPPKITRVFILCSDGRSLSFEVVASTVYTRIHSLF
jgi:hypothetical protein